MVQAKMMQAPQQNWRFGDFRLDGSRRRLERHGEMIELKGKAFDAVVLLIAKRGEPVSREELIDALWPDTVVGEANLTQAISVARKALGDTETPRRYIETISRSGYQFIAEVTQDEPGDFHAEDAGEEVHDTQRRTPGWRILLLASVASAVVLAIAGAVYFLQPNRTESTPRFEPVPLTSYAGAEQSPSFSPDGREVAFSWTGPENQSEDIYVKTIGSEELRRLTTHPAGDASPAWSPDGSQIAFIRGRHEVYVISPRGGTERLLARSERLILQPVWAPDGKSLVIRTHQVPIGRMLHRIWLEDGQLEPFFAPDPKPGSDNAAYSHDGAWLAFSILDRGRTSLYVQATGGGEPVEVASTANEVQSMTWSPDNETVLFAARRPGFVPFLWRVSRHGGPAEPVVGLSQEVYSPAVSASANRLAYKTGRNVFTLWRYPLGSPEDKGARFTASTFEEIQPDVSPDGKRVAYIGAQSGSREIWIADIHGQNRRQLTKTSLSETNCWPVWSPDGHWIAYVRSPALYVVDPETGRSQSIISKGVMDVRPAWAPDGSWIYFVSQSEGNATQIWRAAMAGGELEQITRNGGTSPRLSTDGQSILFGREGKGIWRARLDGSQESPLIPELPDAHSEDWVIDGEGVYYSAPAESKADQPVFALYHWRFGQPKPELIRRFPGRPSWREAIAISPNKRWVFCSHFEANGDLMLIENFR